MKTIKVPAYIGFKMKRTKNQFRVDTFRAGGKGGQNQNKVNSGARITDLVTGLSAEGRDERTFLQNKTNAFFRLVNKMISFYKEEFFQKLHENEINNKTIRSYKVKNNLVIDHRLNKQYNLQQLLEGKLDEIHKDLLENVINDLDI